MRKTFDIKAGDSLEADLAYNGDDGTTPTSVRLGVRTAKTMKGKYEPLYLCADQCDQVALELVRLGSQLRAAEAAAKAADRSEAEAVPA